MPKIVRWTEKDGRVVISENPSLELLEKDFLAISSRARKKADPSLATLSGVSFQRQGIRAFSVTIYGRSYRFQLFPK